MPELVDQFGRPIDKGLLRQEIAGPSLTGVRQTVAGLVMEAAADVVEHPLVNFRPRRDHGVCCHCPVHPTKSRYIPLYPGSATSEALSPALPLITRPSSCPSSRPRSSAPSIPSGPGPARPSLEALRSLPGNTQGRSGTGPGWVPRYISMPLACFRPPNHQKC